jgi:hypothetical protein
MTLQNIAAGTFFAPIPTPSHALYICHVLCTLYLGTGTMHADFLLKLKLVALFSSVYPQGP